VTIFSFMFLWVFYAYVRKFLPVDRARLAVVLVLLYPASLFLTVCYSESLFLLCLFAFLYFYDGKHWGAVVFAMLLPLAEDKDCSLRVEWSCVWLADFAKTQARRKIRADSFWPALQPGQLFISSSTK